MHDRPGYIWGGAMMFRTSELKQNVCGLMDAWTDGGYSEDFATLSLARCRPPSPSRAATAAPTAHASPGPDPGPLPRALPPAPPPAPCPGRWPLPRPLAHEREPAPGQVPRADQP